MGASAGKLAHRRWPHRPVELQVLPAQDPRWIVSQEGARGQFQRVSTAVLAPGLDDKVAVIRPAPFPADQPQILNVENGQCLALASGHGASIGTGARR